MAAATTNDRRAGSPGRSFAHERCRGRLVHRVVVQQLDLTLQVGQRVVQGEQPEPLRAHRDQLEPAVLEPVDPAYDCGAAGPVQRTDPSDPVDPGLPALADRDHAELPWFRPPEQVPHQLPVAFLEDMQRQEHAGIQHRAEREQRQRLRHTTTVRARGA